MNSPPSSVFVKFFMEKTEQKEIEIFKTSIIYTIYNLYYF